MGCTKWRPPSHLLLPAEALPSLNDQDYGNNLISSLSLSSLHPSFSLPLPILRAFHDHISPKRPLSEAGRRLPDFNGARVHLCTFQLGFPFRPIFPHSPFSHERLFAPSLSLSLLLLFLFPPPSFFQNPLTRSLSLSVCDPGERKMGKYIKKSKGTGEVAVMEVSAQGGCLGVRTRARALALQRDAAASLQKTASYLQLRSRRLEKHPFLSSSARSAEQAKPPASDHHKRATPIQERSSPPVCTVAKATDGLTSTVNSARSSSVSVSLSCSVVRSSGNKAGEATERGASAGKPVSESDAAVEASFGENILEGDGRESCRSIRETTPCSLIRNSESLEAPGSTTRPTTLSQINRRTRSETRRSIPTAEEMEEFFAAAERQQLRRFSEKYNFDPVNDLPLPGRYEWIQLTP